MSDDSLDAARRRLAAHLALPLLRQAFPDEPGIADTLAMFEAKLVATPGAEIRMTLHLLGEMIEQMELATAEGRLHDAQAAREAALVTLGHRPTG